MGPFNPPLRAGSGSISVTPARFNSIRLLGSHWPNNVAGAGEPNSATPWTSGQKLTPELCPTVTDGVHGPRLHIHLNTIERYPQKRCLQRERLVLHVTAVEMFRTSAWSIVNPATPSSVEESAYCLYAVPGGREQSRPRDQELT